MSMFEEQEGPDRPRPLGPGIYPTGHRRADEWAVEEHATALREGRGCWHCWGIAQGISAARKGSVPATFPTAEERDGAPLPEGYVWLGTFSGWEIGIMRRHEHAGGDTLCLHHRCGWAEPLAPCGTQDDHSVYLGNIIERALEVAETHTCAPHQPSPEHQERMARWEAALRRADEARKERLRGMTRNSGAPIFPDPDEGLGRSEASERVSGPPAPLLYADAPGLTTPQHVGRLADWPGHGTPAEVTVECLGDQCTGCSDSRCWTAQADGGDV